MADGTEDEGEPAVGRPSLLDALRALRDAGRTEVRHGEAVIRFRHGRPVEVAGALLPDGSHVDARCIAWLGQSVRLTSFDDEGTASSGDGGLAGPAHDAGVAVDPAFCIWQRRLAPGHPTDPRARRGQLVVEPGVAVRFVDDPRADVTRTAPADLPSPDLERDLAGSRTVVEAMRSDLYATLLYAALSNTAWRHRATGARWSCSWRVAGDVVARLRGEGCYMDWYGGGGEGLVDEVVLADVEAMGWELAGFDATPEDRSSR